MATRLHFIFLCFVENIEKDMQMIYIDVCINKHQGFILNIIDIA